MILIADSGSSKTEWCLIDGSSKTEIFRTEGYNPCYTGADKLSEILQSRFSGDFDLGRVVHLAFYGAGVRGDRFSLTEQALRSVFPRARIELFSDLTGAARALLGRESGFAAILGTGANSCLYDGDKITHNIYSLGFLLGDEGSGAYMGKRLVRDYLRNCMPEELRIKFRDTYRLTDSELISRVYSTPEPNAYCASFTHFLTDECRGHEYLEQRIIRDSFRDFFGNIVSRYPDYRRYSFNCAGSIAEIFRRELTEVAQEYGMSVGNIIKTPMSGLIRFHLGEQE
jgi:hypothetical protein